MGNLFANVNETLCYKMYIINDGFISFHAYHFELKNNNSS